jgi:glycosyltransferase involved in cell wall biosynthesis
MPLSERPLVSVIIASWNAAATIAGCLESTLHQETGVDYEVIVADSSADRTPELVRQRFPTVRLLHFSERKFCGSARNAGLTLARGEIIAFLDADCRAHPRWIEEIVAAHRGPHSVVQGAVRNGAPESLVSWAYYFLEFSLWLPGGPSRPIRELAGCCLSIKRRAFECHGAFLEDSYGSDTALQWKLERAGELPFFCPGILAEHSTTCGLTGFLKHELRHGADFARVRMREQRLPRGYRALLVVLAPLLPLVLILRITLRVLRAGTDRRRFAQVSPLILAGAAAWSLGELAGYLLPKRRGAER